MKIKTDEITSVIKQEIEQFSSELEISEVGQVVEVGDGIARIYGLSGCMAGELLEFETPRGTVMGQAMNLEEDTVGAIIYGDYLAVEEGNVTLRPRHPASRLVGGGFLDPGVPCLELLEHGGGTLRFGGCQVGFFTDIFI